MCITEYDEARTFAEQREEGWAEGRREGHREGRKEGRAEGRKEGRAEGRKEGRAETQLDIIREMLKEGFALSDALRLAKMDEPTWQKLNAQS